MVKILNIKKLTPFILPALLAASLPGCGLTAGSPLEEGELAFEENRFRDAQIYLQEALKEHSDNPETHLLYGETLLGLGDYLGAQTAFSKIAAGSAVYEQSRLLNAKAMALDGKSEEALALVLELDPESLTAEQKALRSWSHGFALLSLDREDEAVDIMDAAIKANPKNADLLTLKAKYFFERADYDRAKGLLAISLDADPNLFESLLLSGRINMIANDMDAAKQAFEKAASLYPDSRSPLFALASITFDGGDYDRSRDYINALLKLNGDDPRALLILGQLELADGKIDETLQILQKIDANAEKMPLAFLLKGKIALARENYELAEESLTKFLSAYPNDERGLIELSKTYVAKGNKAEAVKLVEPVIRNANAKPAALQYVAQLLSENNDVRAGNLALRAKIAGKTDITQEMIKAEQAIKLGEWAAAEAVYKKLRSNGHGENPLVLNNSAMVALKSGKIDDAEAFARAAYNIAPQDPQIMDSLGYILLKRGTEKQEALRLIQEAAKILPGHRGVQTHLAQAYRANGNAGAAESIEKKLRS